MVYICADDYGLCTVVSEHIKQCLDDGALNKVSVFPNFDAVDLDEILKGKNHVSLHLNLVEGKCMADDDEFGLLTDENKNFKNTFVKLLVLSFFNSKKLEKQLYREIKAQVVFWKSILPEGAPFMVDGHQHTHMIPAVFKTLFKVSQDEKIRIDYIRVPAEPILPYLKVPSLYFTYNPVNVIKQLLLKFLWLFNEKTAKSYGVSAEYFFGVLMSGNMDKKRVNKILPEYIKLAEKSNKDVEVLFHPGYIDGNEVDFKNMNVVFEKFYKSQGRKTEFDAAMNL